MNVLAIVPDLRAPSCRFRVRQYLEPLKSEGIVLEIAGLGRPGRERRRLFERARDFDAALVHRKLLNYFDFRRLRRSARRLIYDFDDAVMFRDSNSPRRTSRVRLSSFRRMAGGSDLVIAGNEYLAAFARPLNARVHVLPTPVDLSRFPDRPAPGAGTTAGWMGTKSNFIYLGLAEEALRRLTRSRPGFVFAAISDEAVEMPGIAVVRKEWSLEDEVNDLRKFDVGIMPLFDDEWAKGKCALKILQYFAAFLPVVCSPVGTNREVVSEGVNGFFARDPRKWEEKIKILLDSPETREKMGRAGRRLVEEKYALSVVAPRFAVLLRGEDLPPKHEDIVISNQLSVISKSALPASGMLRADH
ncbi:MAG: glycosyltransferase family 4 protein [Candidatus Aureabacteria bacterium]|nr:glycosyltransferase family 4 protein [Candidatus Auribacterota bacterium]